MKSNFYRIQEHLSTRESIVRGGLGALAPGMDTDAHKSAEAIRQHVPTLGHPPGNEGLVPFIAQTKNNGE